MLPLPMRLGSIDEFVAQTRTLIVHADAALVIDVQLGEFVEPVPGDPPIVLLDELRGAPGSYDRPADDPDRSAILQFTSGSTADPKGVMLPHRCVTANMDAIVEAADSTPTRPGASWLPLYHDMGLIGLLDDPDDDRHRPRARRAPGLPRRAGALDASGSSEFGGTVTRGPNFSYALAARPCAGSTPSICRPGASR